MPIFTEPLPLSLYVHLPWCVRKCPYCDFNSHEMKQGLPETAYVNTLLQELEQYLPQIQHRPLVSIFFGGGTPSLFSAQAIEQILTGVAKRMIFSPTIEITLEANPGTAEQARFHDFRQAGINRLSLGIQSLQDDKLKALGRIHNTDTAIQAITMAQKAGFTNFNIDLMYGLPQQTIDDAIHDLELALSFQPTHLSWYQLTIEPNTFFHHQPPALPIDDTIWEMQQAGQTLLQHMGFTHYEVSAYAQPGKTCLHNRNYWEFGDYLGIGAGAHSKLTDEKTGSVTRFAQVKHPTTYLDSTKRLPLTSKILAEEDLVFEFMLNALRLTRGVPALLFTQRTGLSLARVEKLLAQAKHRGLLLPDPTHFRPSERGRRFLNDLVGIFLHS
ncbi:MAG: radical SAM family heme chaperone HemW [Gammaproteobacteria bacterium]|nr:MAG: radical SAM family heme chaperone HemW [Gammaproteobacteria bacterium]